MASRTCDGAWKNNWIVEFLVGEDYSILETRVLQKGDPRNKPLPVAVGKAWWGWEDLTEADLWELEQMYRFTAQLSEMRAVLGGALNLVASGGSFLA